ncbi:MAG: hypothetical protein JW779_04015 [Candidatus Thorarchaeota archaeon]|nr:hypothetical protein [Candidatus Thorarchaeota archaeon]
MKPLGLLFLFLNTACGIIYIVTALIDLDFYWLLFINPVALCFGFLIVGFIVQRKIIFPKYSKSGKSDIQIPEINLQLSCLLFIFNIIMFILIWFPFPGLLLPSFLEQHRASMYMSPALVFYFDFEELGRELANSIGRRSYPMQNRGDALLIS